MGAEESGGCSHPGQVSWNPTPWLRWFHVSPSFRIHAPFPSDLHTHSSFRFHPKLRSDSTLPSAFTNDSVTLSAGHFQRVRPAWSWPRGCPLRAGPWPELARGSQHCHLPQPAPCFVPPKMQLIPGGKHLAKAVWGGGPQRSHPKGLQLGPFSATKAQTPSSSCPYHPLLQHASILLCALHSIGPQLALGHTDHLPPDWPQSPKAAFSVDRFLTPVLRGSAASFTRGLSTTRVSFCYHLRRKNICFDVEAGLLFLSLMDTPLWTLLSVEVWQAGSSLSSAFPPGMWVGWGFHADVNKGLPTIVRGLPFPSPRQAWGFPPTMFWIVILSM